MVSLAATLRIGQALRQYDLDFDGSPAPSPIPPRLLILACSATKASGLGLAARDRYDGPLWQSLRVADPDASRAWVAFLSARYGLGAASAELPAYDAVLNRRSAAAMAEAGIHRLHPEIALTQKTAAGRERAIKAAGPRFCARGTVQVMVNQLQQPFRDVAICGGRHYVDVAQAYVAELKEAGLIASAAPVAVINDQIGFMRAGLKAWLTAHDGAAA